MAAGDERYCHRCDGPNIVWFAPSSLWNAVMRAQPEPYELHDGIVCPTCFGILADQAGHGGIFRLDVPTSRKTTMTAQVASTGNSTGPHIRVTAGI